MTKKIVFSILIILICTLISISGVFAWFFIQNSKEMYGYSGNIDLNVKAYYGKDDNHDGVLNYSYDNYNNFIEYSRSERLSEQYEVLDKDVMNEFDNIYYSKTITYKIIVENPSDKIDANISVNFSDMKEYFYKQISYYYQHSELPELSTLFSLTLNDNTSRLWFTLSDLNVDIYTKDDNIENNIENGYSEIVRSSRGIEGIEKIDKLNTLEDSDNLLYNFSSEEKFINNVLVKSGELAEINFSLVCEQSRTGVENYISIANDLYLDRCVSAIKKEDTNISDGTATTIAKSYIKAMCDAECQYLFTDTNSNQNFQFFIDYIYIKGTQV